MRIKPVPGAASYWAEHTEVLMRCTSGYLSAIQTCRSHEMAIKAAERWQKKENAAVTRANKKVTSK